MSPSNRNRRGLTLMELMVVIAILAVLAAIALPAYQAARARANVARSVNNLKQIHLALRLYAETHGQNSPFGLGLPDRGLSTLLDLNMIPLELMRTGGTPWAGEPGHLFATYVWFPPDYITVRQDEFASRVMRDWQEHVERTGGNPVIAIDPSHNPLSGLHDPFYPKLVIVLWADGSVQTTRRRGALFSVILQKRSWEHR